MLSTILLSALKKQNAILILHIQMHIKYAIKHVIEETTK